jgi:hypothetical protein
MVDTVTDDGGANVVGDLLGGELGRMDANNHHFVGILLTELTQLRNIMVAVNSTKGPKFQQHNFAAQIGHAERLRGVQPI